MNKQTKNLCLFVRNTPERTWQKNKEKTVQTINEMKGTPILAKKKKTQKVK